MEGVVVVEGGVATPNNQPKERSMAEVPANNRSMAEVMVDIYAEYIMMAADCVKAAGGNKTAGRRSRQSSLKLERLFKEWRRVSVTNGEK